MSDHTFEQTVFGKDADDVWAKAEAAVMAYFGPDLTGVEWSVDAEGRLNMGGQVVSYQARVKAQTSDAE